MQCKEPDWQQLWSATSSWLDDAYSRVQKMQPSMTDEESYVGLAASYCLLSCHDYLESAFDAFKNGRFYAGLACCRPVAETAITFLWCVQGGQEPRVRFERWMKETLSQDKRYLEGLSGISIYQQKSNSHSLQGALQRTREMLDKVSCRKCLPNIRQRLGSIDQHMGNEQAKAADLYPTLYQFLCPSVHGGFMPERYFRVERDICERVERVAMPLPTPWVVLTPAFFIAAAVFKFFHWDYSYLKASYEKAVQSVHQRLTEES